MAYAVNFDLADAADRELLMAVTVAEAIHWAKGDRGTELHAACRSKRANMAERRRCLVIISLRLTGD